MKIASYRDGNRNTYGVVVEGGVVDVGRRLAGRYPTLRAVLAAGALEEVAKASRGQAPDRRLEEIAFLPVIPDPEKIICIGINYAAHAREGGRELPTHPPVFARFANSQVGHLQPMIKPRVSDRLDFEGELAAVIGKGGRHIPAERALTHVAGYACYNEGSVRDWQRHSIQWTAGKNFPGTGGFGPWMVTADELPDPSKLTLVTRLNGDEMQRSGTDDLIFGVPALIAYCSTFTVLEPGDVIVTGTPSGVGLFREPPVFMKPGDVVEVEISGIGVLRNPVVAE